MHSNGSIAKENNTGRKTTIFYCNQNRLYCPITLSEIKKIKVHDYYERVDFENKTELMELCVDGTVKLYARRKVGSSPYLNSRSGMVSSSVGLPYDNTVYYVLKDDILYKANKKKKLADILRDNEEIVKLIHETDKGYYKYKVEDIVNKYNNMLQYKKSE